MSESSKQSSEFESVKYEEARVRVRPLPEVEGHFFAGAPENFAGGPENFAADSNAS